MITLWIIGAKVAQSTVQSNMNYGTGSVLRGSKSRGMNNRFHFNGIYFGEFAEALIMVFFGWCPRSLTKIIQIFKKFQKSFFSPQTDILIYNNFKLY